MRRRLYDLRMSLEEYLDPEDCPSERPKQEDMHASTAALHNGIDKAIRSSAIPYLHPESKTLQLDLLGSPNMVAWQESKLAAMFEEECWSQLPQVYARYGTETTAELLGEVKKLEDDELLEGVEGEGVAEGTADGDAAKATSNDGS